MGKPLAKNPRLPIQFLGWTFPEREEGCVGEPRVLLSGDKALIPVSPPANTRGTIPFVFRESNGAVV